MYYKLKFKIMDFISGKRYKKQAKTTTGKDITNI